MNDRPASWPGGKRIAVLVSILFETWSDGKGPSDVYRDTFEYLREHEPMGLLHVAFHSHFGGRPLMTAIFDRLLKFLAAQPDAYFPGHNALAKWVLERGDDDLSNAKRFFA